MNSSAIKNGNRDIQEHIRMGENLFAQGKTVEAIECFQSALAQDPENTTALNNLGVIAYQLNDGRLAEDFLVKAVRLNRRDPESLGNLVAVYLQQGARPKACQLQTKALLGGISLPDPANRFSEPPRAPVLQTSRKQDILAPKKILVINNLFPPQELGGYGRIMADYVDLLRQRGHQVLVLTSDMRAFGLPPESEPQVQRTLQLFGEWTRSGLIEYPRERILEINAQNEQVIYRILNYFHPDLCLAGNLDLLSVWVFRPFFARCIPVVHQIGNEFIGYHAADSPQSPLYHVVTASQWLKEEALRRGYPFQKACAIYSGAFTGQFQMALPPATDRLRIAYAGLVNGYKGPQVLIEALNLLARKNIPFSCTVAGGSFDSLFVESQKNRVQALGLSGKIRFAGLLNREGLKDLFARHNVLVFPSLVPETFGISQVEAMAAGLLVISSATGGAREVILDNETGLYFKAGDYSRLAFLLMEMLQDRPRWERLAQAGEQYALSHFDIESSVDQLEEVFRQALEDQKGGT